MMFEICTDTDQDLVRDNNEDAVAFDSQPGLCLLADGMGDHNAGEIASGLACTFIKFEMSRWLSQAGLNADSQDVKRALAECVQNANHSILDAANTNPQHTGMGTTLVVAVFQAGRVMLGHIGDSRCYRLRTRDFQQITKDHLLLQEQIGAGLITPEQALRSVNKNLITRAFGVQACRLLDVTERRVKVGDIYLMCSDGLSDMVRDACIADFLLGDATLAQKAKQLIVAANAGGGRVNISVALTHAKKATPKRGFCPACAGNSKNVWRIKKAVVSYAKK